MKTNNLHPIDRQAAFNQLVAEHDFLLVLFTASWCAPCQTFAPVFADMAANTPAIAFAVADVDVATDLAANFQVSQVPAMMVIRERVVIDMVQGAMQAHELQHHLQMWQALEMSAINAHFSAPSAAS